MYKILKIKRKSEILLKYKLIPIYPQKFVTVAIAQERGGLIYYMFLNLDLQQSYICNILTRIVVL